MALAASTCGRVGKVGPIDSGLYDDIRYFWDDRHMFNACISTSVPEKDVSKTALNPPCFSLRCSPCSSIEFIGGLSYKDTIRLYNLIPSGRCVIN